MSEIHERQGFIDALTRKYLTDPEPEPNGNGNRTHSHTPRLSDEEIIDRCREAKNAAKFASLFDGGDTSGHGHDDSRADMALASMIAFYTDDPEQLERLIGASALGRRDKWRDRADYRRRTIDRAIRGQRDTYTPPRPGKAGREHAEAAEGRVNPLLAGRVLLQKAMEEGIEPPDELEPGVLLKGKVHQVFAASGLGKTMFALWLTKRCIERGQRVVYLDDENGARTISERLQDMGVDSARVDEFLYYLPFPHLPMTQEAQHDFMALLKGLSPALVVFDSWINFLAGAGLNENENTDIQVWSATYTKPAREMGITTVVLDHVPHEGARARGASRKKDEADVQWQLYRTKHFDRTSVGELTLHREKDRDDWLDSSVRFSVGGAGDGRLIFHRSAGTVEEPDPTDGLTDSARKLLEVLRTKFAETGAGASEWAKAADLSRQAVYRSKDTLIGRELVREERRRYYPIDGPGGGGESVTPDTDLPGDGVTAEDGPSREGVTPHHEPGVTPEYPTDKGETSEVSQGVTHRNTDLGVTAKDGVTSCNNPLKGVTDVTPTSTPMSTPRGGSGRSLTPDEAAKVKRLIHGGMSRKQARIQVLAPNHPVGCRCEVCA